MIVILPGGVYQLTLGPNTLPPILFESHEPPLSTQTANKQKYRDHDHPTSTTNHYLWYDNYEHQRHQEQQLFIPLSALSLEACWDSPSVIPSHWLSVEVADREQLWYRHLVLFWEN